MALSTKHISDNINILKWYKDFVKGGLIYEIMPYIILHGQQESFEEKGVLFILFV